MILLAQFAAVLPLDPDRMLALLGQAGVIEAQDALCGVAEPLHHHHLGKFGLQRFGIPGRVRQEVLHLLQGAVGKDFCHLLDVLPRQVRDQAEQVVGAVLDAALPREHRPEPLNEPLNHGMLDLADHDLRGWALLTTEGQHFSR